MHKKKIVIFGGTGFIGSNIAKYLRSGNYSILLVSRKKISKDSSIKAKNISYKNCNILNFKEVLEAITDADVVINCAGHSGIQQSIINPVKNLRINCEGIINILEACKRKNINCRIIQISSQLEIQNKNEFDSFINSPYGLSKFCASQYIEYYVKNYHINAVILRLPNVYGPHYKIKNKNYGILNYFIDLAMTNKAIPIFSDGLEKRNFVYIEDVTKLIVKIINSKRNHNKIISVKANKEVAVIEAAKKIVEITGFGKTKYTKIPKNFREPKSKNHFQLSKYTAKTAINKGLELTIEKQKDIIPKINHEK